MLNFCVLKKGKRAYFRTLPHPHMNLFHRQQNKMHLTRSFPLSNESHFSSQFSTKGGVWHTLFHPPPNKNCVSPAFYDTLVEFLGFFLNRFFFSQRGDLNSWKVWGFASPVKTYTRGECGKRGNGIFFRFDWKNMQATEPCRLGVIWWFMWKICYRYIF